MWPPFLYCDYAAARPRNGGGISALISSVEIGGTIMSVTLRRPTPDDAPELGRILFTAFQTLADRHNFARDFPSIEIATGAVTALSSHPGFYGVAAEADGRLAGSSFVDLRSTIAGIGPVSVDPDIQNRSVGRQLMEAAMQEARARGCGGIRLLQAAYHNRSLCLYTKLGFITREPISLLNGAPLDIKFDGYAVRPATMADAAACDDLCRRVHGFDRGGELRDAIAAGSATVVDHLGRISGYASEVGFLGYAVAEGNRDLMALIGAAPAITGAGLLLPTRNHEVFTWCLAHGLKLVMQMTSMTIGLYNEPRGAYLTSVLY
jgi:GNAT superfamily N-acetyltransferase